MLLIVIYTITKASAEDVRIVTQALHEMVLFLKNEITVRRVFNFVGVAMIQILPGKQKGPEACASMP
jgi:hypothetical protein